MEFANSKMGDPPGRLTNCHGLASSAASDWLKGGNGLGLSSAAGGWMVRVVGPWREAVAPGDVEVSPIWSSTHALLGTW